MTSEKRQRDVHLFTGVIAGLVQHGFQPDHPLMQLLTEQLEGRLEALRAPPNPNAPSPDERRRHRVRNAELVEIAELAIAVDDPEAEVLAGRGSRRYEKNCGNEIGAGVCVLTATGSISLGFHRCPGLGRRGSPRGSMFWARERGKRNIHP